MTMSKLNSPAAFFNGIIKRILKGLPPPPGVARKMEQAAQMMGPHGSLPSAPGCVGCAHSHTDVTASEQPESASVRPDAEFRIVDAGVGGVTHQSPDCSVFVSLRTASTSPAAFPSCVQVHTQPASRHGHAPSQPEPTKVG